MALYVALYDIHPGDRRAFERMFEKEAARRLSEKNHGNGNCADDDYIYLESYGSVEALFKMPQRYDLFVIDGTNSEEDGLIHGEMNFEILRRLRKLEIEVPVVLFFRDISVAEGKSTEDSGRVRLMQKMPLLAELKEICDWAFENKKPVMGHIELRGAKETIYVHPEEIVYMENTGSFLKCCLTGDRELSMLMNADYFLDSLGGENKKKSGLLKAAKDLIVNTSHIVRFKGSELLLDTGLALQIGFADRLLYKKQIVESLK